MKNAIIIHYTVVPGIKKSELEFTKENVKVAHHYVIDKFGVLHMPKSNH